MHQVNVAWARLPRRAALAYALLKIEVARTCEVSRREVQLAKLCGQCGSDKHGKPYVVRAGAITPPHVSLSRAGCIAIVAVTHSGPVGVDVERADAPSFRGFGQIALHPDEVVCGTRDRAITWVRKESLLKATGDGLMADPRKLRLSQPGSPPRVVEWAAANPPSRGVWMHDARVHVGHVASVSVLTPERPSFTVREEVREGLLPQASL